MSNSSIKKYTKESIMLTLRYNKNECTIVDKKSNARCSSTFGLSGKIILLVVRYSYLHFCLVERQYRKTSYLGCTAHWTDEWRLRSFGLFCLPYNTPNKKAPSVLKALEEDLSLYDLNPFVFDVIWVCDGGNNVLKALERYTVVHCVVHRLNNCLQSNSFQSKTIKVKKHSLFLDYYHKRI
ncbi:unnamed protein product [Adineta steineri]|uniref:Uncharacterized protein n=1 Tax=Adineta steineri TaxID=433720 RepID=A0A815HXK0_9BILA|nr:unnamed protein product [Adineta steineri]